MTVFDPFADGSVPVNKALYKVLEIAEIFGLSKSKVFMLLQEGRLKAVRETHYVPIARGSLAEWLRSLPDLYQSERQCPAGAPLLRETKVARGKRRGRPPTVRHG